MRVIIQVTVISTHITALHLAYIMELSDLLKRNRKEEDSDDVGKTTDRHCKLASLCFGFDCPLNREIAAEIDRGCEQTSAVADPYSLKSRTAHDHVPFRMMTSKEVVSESSSNGFQTTRQSVMV